jgi:hypothetical protein
VLLYDHELRLLVAEGEVLVEPESAFRSFSGRTLQAALPPRAWQAMRPHARAALRGDQHEIDYTCEDGSRVYRVTFGPVRDDHGEVQAGLASPRT